MEPYYAGALSVLPPVIAVVLALVTKEVFSSLMIGILTGTCIYSFGLGEPMPVIKTVEHTFTLMVEKVDFSIVLFCSLLGSLVYVIAMAGGSRAYGQWAATKIKGRRSALLSTSGLGIRIFIELDKTIAVRAAILDVIERVLEATHNVLLLLRT